MTTQDIAPTQLGKKKSTSRFQRLWDEAEAMSKDNIELEKKLDALVSRVDKEILSAEREMGETVRQMVYRQLEFAKRKSLLKWQREELSEWINENLLELSMVGLLDEPLQNAVAEFRAAQMGIDLDPDSDLSAAEQLDKHFAERFADDEEWWDDDESDEDGLDDMFDDEFDDLLNDIDEQADEDVLAELLRKMREESGEQAGGTSPSKEKSLINDDVFKRLFRQTAAALHPDREKDEERRKEKHVLMSQLLKARKERDLVSIVKLHERHATAESSLSADDEQALEEVLVEYLNQQQSRMDEIIHKSPVHEMAYSEFYSVKPATVTRKINAHLRKVRERRNSLTDFISEVKTLKSLKAILEVRYESRSFHGDWF